MWSFVGKKKTPRWLWHALDHRTGKVLAYVFGRREDQAFLELKTLLVPFGIRRFYTEGWGAYQRHLDPMLHEVGKHHTQQLERKHLTLRTRISAWCARRSVSRSPPRCTISSSACSSTALSSGCRYSIEEIPISNTTHPRYCPATRALLHPGEDVAPGLCAADAGTGGRLSPHLLH